MAESTAPRPFVFVLMPFSEQFEDEYTLAIKPACDAAGAYAERVDEQMFREDILDRIRNQIMKADLIVSEMTGLRPNVLYETGYAHALNKHVLMLTQSSDEIPFDLKHYPFILHEPGQLDDLKAELERRVRQFLEMGRQGEIPQEIPVDVAVNDVELTATILDQVSIFESAVGIRDLELQVVVRNQTLRVVKPVEIQIALMTPSRFQRKAISGGEIDVNRHEPDDDLLIDPHTRLHVWRRAFNILPGSWQQFRFQINSEVQYSAPQVVGRFGIRILTSNGYFDYPFVVAMALRKK
jgi:hypothetical protein